MPDPYDILGIKRGASLAQIKSAYRHACKTKHPDLGGSHAEFIELQAAYDFILKELKSSYQSQQQESSRSGRTASSEEGTSQSSGASSAGAETGDRAKEQDRQWQNTYREIDEELEELRRAWQAREDALREMRKDAWQSGDRAAWAKLTCVDLSRFVASLLRSGLKGIAVLVAALVGVGSVLVEANFISFVILLFSGLGFFFSLAVKNDKGGFMSAGLLLFGMMTIWLPSVRAALFLYPLATISVIVCLALILKFAQQGGTAGLLTGGVLSLYMIGVIVQTTQQQAQGPAIVTRPNAPVDPAVPQPGKIPDTPPPEISKPVVAQIATNAPALVKPPSTVIQPVQPEPVTLIAAQGSMLKLNAGIPYRLKLRAGMTTTLVAAKGSFAFDATPGQPGDCVTSVDLSAGAASLPYAEHGRAITACAGDAIVRVEAVR